MFAFRVLGGASLNGEKGPLSGKAVQPRRIALLALLASHPDRVLSRDKLIALLWPESDADQGRHRLSESLYVLRRELGEGALVSEGDRIRLDVDRVACDAVAFRTAIRSGDLEGAVTRHAGPFLDGFFLKDSPEFDQWVEYERLRLADEYGRALEALATAAAADGNGLKAVEWWSRLAAHDPYNSRFALGLMEAMAQAGDPGNAIDHARQHARCLREELGIEPTAALLAFAERLRHGEMSGADPRSRVDHPPEDQAGGQADSSSPRKRWHRGRVRILAAVAGAAGLALIAFGSGALRSRYDAADRQAMLIVIPFENLGEVGDDYIVSGISEEIVARLSTVSALGVIGRTTANQYRGTPRSASEIGEELGVDLVVDGSARIQHRSEGRVVRASIQLIRTDDARILWSQTYEELLSDILEVESDIAHSVVRELEVRLLEPEESSLAAGGTGDIQARDYYLLGRHALGSWNRTGITQGIQHLQEAVEVDPSYARGYAGLAYALAVLAGWEFADPQSTWPRAREAAETALALDEGLAEAHTALALEAMSYRHEWNIAREGFERALDLNPSSVDAMVWFALLESGIWGRQDVALELLSRAERLDPRSREVQYNLGFIRFQMGDSVGAIATFRRLMESAPEFYGGLDGLSIVYTALGRYPAALEAGLRADERYGSTYDQQIGFVGFLYGRMGRREEALHQLDRLEALEADGGRVSPMARARIHAGLGEVDEAMFWLERAWEEGSHWLIWLGWEPWYWEGLASDPRFHALVDRMNYPTPFARRVLAPDPS